MTWTLSVIAASLAVLLPFSAGAAKQQDWPQSYFDGGHSNYNPQEKTLTTANVSGLKPKWGLAANYQVYAAALQGGVVYVQGYNGDTSTWELRALNAQKGTVKWTVSMSAYGIFGDARLAAAGGLVFTQCSAPDNGGTQVSGICAFSQTDGHAVWQYISPCGCIPESYLVTPPTYDHGAIYFGYGYGTGTGFANYIVSLNAKSGQIRWSYNVGGNNSLTGAAPAVSGGRVYFGCGIPNVGIAVCALSEQDGSLLWYGAPTNDVRNISVDKDGVYALECGSSTSLVKLRPATGAQVWTFGLDSCGSRQVGLAGQYVYFSGDQLYALNAKSGTLVWSAPNPASSPVIANGVVFIEGGFDSSGNGSFATAYDGKNGDLLWSAPEGRPYWNWDPMVVNGTFYYGADSTCGSICADGLKRK